MDAPVRRIIAALLFLMLVGGVGAVWRGDSVEQTAGYFVALLVGAGFVIACYLWARRKG